MLTTRPAPAPTPSRVLRLLDDPRIAIATVALAFVTIDLIRTLSYQPGDGTSLLYAVPVTIAAMRFGPRIGAATGVAAFALFAFWVARNDTSAITTSAYITRLVVFVGVGAFVGWLARVRDEVDERSRQLVDVSPDLMATLDDAGRVELANRAWLSAARRDFHLGMPIATVLGDPTPGIHATEQAITFEAGEIRWIDWRVQEDERAGRRYVVGRDVTDRHQQSLHVQQLLSEVQHAREHERAALAADLHDFVLQQMLVALMHLEPLRESGDEAAATAAARVDELVRHATARLRNVIDGIRPLDLDHMTTGAALELCAEQAARDWSINVDVSIDVRGTYSTDLTLLAYRVLGEALHNAAKHSGAGRVEVDATEVDDGLHLRVADDGRGFPVATVVDGVPHRSLGTGFNLLVEQVRSAGGHVKVTSEPGAGTTVECCLPVPVVDSVPLDEG
jgi:signal transduction histidine kinase